MARPVIGTDSLIQIYSLSSPYKMLVWLYSLIYKIQHRIMLYQANSDFWKWISSINFVVRVNNSVRPSVCRYKITYIKFFYQSVGYIIYWLFGW